jgi:hypothetical protein
MHDLAMQALAGGGHGGGRIIILVLLLIIVALVVGGSFTPDGTGASHEIVRGPAAWVVRCCHLARPAPR